jgi:23S rRNA pseudouridine2605 synthase
MTDTKKPTPPPGDRIAKVLSRAGVASRREAERMIEMGEVSVNGRVITSPALNVTAADRITVRGEPVGAPDVARLWLYYKPDGLVTSTNDEKGRQTVFDTLPEDMPRVMSVGRLDLNSEGLLLLTNDGELKRRLELPSTGWLRKYRVRIKGNPTDPDLEPLRKGITVDGERFQPMMVTLDRHQGANAWLSVALREGKNREIRRALTAINLTVNRLIRTSYGPFRLGDMEPGDIEEVRGRVLRDQLGLDPNADDSGFAKSGAAKSGAAKAAKAGHATRAPAKTRTVTRSTAGADKLSKPDAKPDTKPRAPAGKTRAPSDKPKSFRPAAPRPKPSRQ